MDSNLENSIASITSADDNNKNLGTGFVVYKDTAAAYVLTCAHVVRELGGEGKVEVDKHPSTVLALNEAQGLDIALLKVEDLSKEPLVLSEMAQSGKRLLVSCFPSFQRHLVLFEGSLGEKIDIEQAGERISGWLLEFDDRVLTPGCSGSPVIDADTGHVIGLVSHSLNPTSGVALSVEGIEKFWRQGLKNELIEIGQTGEEHLDQLNKRLSVIEIQKAGEERLSQLEKRLAEMETQYMEEIDSKSEELLRWLSSHRVSLAQKASRYALSQEHSPKRNVITKEEEEDFCWELEKYLESLYYSLLSGDSALLSEPAIEPSLSIDLYSAAFSYIKKKIPARLGDKNRVLLDESIQYLVESLSVINSASLSVGSEDRKSSQ
ncbi:MAG: serine protease [Cyanobacteria bacterium J06627_32]